MVRIVIMSTYFENIGDDLIRAGLLYLLKSVYGEDIEIRHVSKSNILSLYVRKIHLLSHAPIRRLNCVNRIVAKLACFIIRKVPWLDKIDVFNNADVFVIAGTPIFYILPEASFLGNEIWPHHYFKRALQSKLHIMSIGVGSIIRNSVESIVIDKRFEKEIKFISEYLYASNSVFVRDNTTYQLLNKATSNNNIVKSICPSMWACNEFNICRNQLTGKSQIICISFSTESTAWDKQPQEFKDTQINLFFMIAQFYITTGFKIKLIAHNELDYVIQNELTRELKIEKPLLLSAKELLDCLNTSMAAITWRVHGAMAALSIGIPVILIKTDNRYLMAEELGAVVLDSEKTSEQQLNEVLYDFMARNSEKSARIQDNIKLAKDINSKIIAEQLQKVKTIVTH